MLQLCKPLQTADAAKRAACPFSWLPATCPSCCNITAQLCGWCVNSFPQCAADNQVPPHALSVAAAPEADKLQLPLAAASSSSTSAAWTTPHQAVPRPRPPPAPRPRPPTPRLQAASTDQVLRSSCRRHSSRHAPPGSVHLCIHSSRRQCTSLYSSRRQCTSL